MAKHVTIQTKVKKVVQRGAKGIPGDSEIQRGILSLSAEEDTTAVLADTWYPIEGVFADGLNLGFTLAADGVLTHTGATGVFLVNGVSDLAVSAASKITYGLFINDTLVPGATTPHDFAASAKTQNISITEIAQILLNDEIQIKLMSDTPGIVVTVTNLKVTFWGGY